MSSVDAATPRETAGVAPAESRLAAGSLGTIAVIFCIVTAAAPIAGLLFNGPLAVLGAGWAAPAAFLVVGVVLTIFAVGYVQMAKRVSAAGGFYTFVSHGLGRTVGLGAAACVVFAYVLFAAQQGGSVGYWVSTTLDSWFSIDIPGWPIVLAAAVLVTAMAQFDIKITARILGVALVGEVVALMILSLAILFSGGDSGISLAPLNPVELFSDGNGAKAAFGSAAIGIALFGAYFSWVGFEMGPNYAEEARDPKRTMGPATYGAVLGLTALYVFCMWMFVSGWGEAGTTESVALQYGLVEGQTLPNEYGSAFYPLTDRYVGNWLTYVFQALIMTSAFACQVALYNTAARYVFSMSRERLLPAKLAKVHPVHRTPQAANLLVGGLMLAYAVVFIIFDSSTLAQLTKTSTYGALMGVFALLVVQILCSVAIVRYFLTVARDGFQVGQTLIAPLLGGAGIVAAAYFLLKYRADLAGGEPLFIKAIPFVIAAVLIGGIVWALVLKQRNPDRYEQIGRYVEDEVDGEQVPRLDLSGEGAHRHQGGAA